MQDGRSSPGTRPRPSYRARPGPPRPRGAAAQAERSGRRPPTGPGGPVPRCVMGCHEMSCSACAGFICCSRFGHEAVQSLCPLEGRSQAARSPLPLAGEVGRGAACAPAEAAGGARQAPSRREARPRPLPPSGRGEERRRPELLSSRLQEGRASAAGKLLSRLRGRLGGGPLSRQRKRRGRAFRPALPPFVTFAAFGAAAGAGCPHRSSFSDGERIPVSRVSCAGACARAGARMAAARLARLIARARQRTHLSRRLLTGIQKMAPPGRATPGTRLRMPLPWGPS